MVEVNELHPVQVWRRGVRKDKEIGRIMRAYNERKDCEHVNIRIA